MALVRLVVFLLLLPLATSGTMPAWARLASEPTHVCKCSVEQHDCVCVRCHPDRPDFATSEESVKGRCGDDETVLSGSRTPFVIAAPPALVAESSAAPRETIIQARASDPSIPPPTPPPRA
jgi:hypothetical protein